VPFLNDKPLNLQLRVFLASNTVAMVTYCVMKMVTTSSPMVGQYFDTMIVESNDKEWLSQAINLKLNLIYIVLDI